MVAVYFRSSDQEYGEPRRVKPVGFTASRGQRSVGLAKISFPNPSRTGLSAKTKPGDNPRVQLTADEIAALSKGFPPNLVRPTSLDMHVPLVRDVRDLRGRAISSLVGGRLSITGWWRGIAVL